MRYTVLTILFAAFFQTKSSYPQTFNYRHYTVDDGLISSTIYNVFQDSKGFIWFCTDAGVNRFNGKVFEKFSQDEGLSDNEVFKMYEDTKGRLWFLTYNGKLTFYDGKKFHTADNNPLLAKMTGRSGYYNIYEDSKARLYFISYGGDIFCLDDTLSQQLLLFNSEKKQIGGGLSEIYENNRNEVLVLYPEADSSNLEFIFPNAFSNACPSNQNQYRYKKPGEAYLLSRDGVIQFQNDTTILLIPKSRIYGQAEKEKLFVDRDRNIFITDFTGGIRKYNAGRNYTDEPELFLKGKNISSVFQDSFFNYWFTTLGDGLFFLPSGYFQNLNYSTLNGLSQDDITAVHAGGDGTVWVGYSNGLLTRILKDGKIEEVKIPYAFDNYCRVKKIESDGKGRIWVMADNYVGWMRPDESSLKLLDSHYEIWKDLAINPGTGLPYFAASNGIFKAVQVGNEMEIVKQIQFGEFRTFTVFFDDHDKFLFGSAKGLSMFSGKEMVLFNRIDLFGQRINDISKLDSILLVATDGGGIYFLTEKGVVLNHISTKEGLPSGICRRILLIDNVAWVATKSGLAKITISNPFHYSVQNYTITDFLLSNDIRDIASANDKIYMATDKGLCVMVDRTVKATTTEMPLHFTSFQTGGRNYYTDSTISFRYSSQPSIVQFIALNYKNPKDVFYRYRLSNKNGGWISTTHNQVEFLQLNPGAYTFELSVSSNKATWSAPSKLNFTILPLWWQTAAFKLFSGVVLIVLMYVIARNILLLRFKSEKAILERKHMLELERNRISSDLHDDLGSGLTQIAILSQVAKTKLGASALDSNVLQKISSLSNEMLNKTSEIIWAINPSNDSLKNLVAYLHEFAGNYFEESEVKLEVKIASEIPVATVSSSFRRHVFLIVKEVLQNVLKHANATHVLFYLYVDNQNLVFVIQDNGKGIKKIQPVEGDADEIGLGIRNIRRRAMLLNGDLKIESVNGNGTRIFFSGKYANV